MSRAKAPTDSIRSSAGLGWRMADQGRVDSFLDRPFVSPSPQSFGCCPGAVSLIPDSPRPAFIAGHGFMPDACGARNGYQPWQCGLEQPRSQLTGPMSKLASRANVLRIKGFDKIRLPLSTNRGSVSRCVRNCGCCNMCALLGTQKETQLWRVLFPLASWVILPHWCSCLAHGGSRPARQPCPTRTLLLHNMSIHFTSIACLRSSSHSALDPLLLDYVGLYLVWFWDLGTIWTQQPNSPTAGESYLIHCGLGLL